jgi:hypothetical protein
LKVKGILTIQEGTFNNVFYSKKVIRKAFEKSNLKNSEIFLDFKNTVDAVCGKVISARLSSDDKVYLDCQIFDKKVQELYKQKIPFAIVPKIISDFEASKKNKKHDKLKSFDFISFGLVLCPSDKELFIKRK